MGSIATADTLYAIDGPIQDGTANMNALAPMARLMGAGDLMVEYDQQYERYGVPQPQLLAAPAAADAARPHRPGLLRHAPAQHLGGVHPERAGPLRAGQRRLALPDRHLHGAQPHGPCVRGESDTGAVVMEGDATGLNNLAGLGLLNTDSAIYYAGTLADQPARLNEPGLAGRPARGDRHQPQAGLPLGHAHGELRLHRDAGRRTRPRRT